MMEVRSRIIRWSAVMGLTFVLGGHWAVLQSVAWVTMAAGYAQAEPLKQALVKTFDGEHPCSLCKLVAEGKRSQQRQEAPTPLAKLDLFLVKQSAAIYPPIPLPVAPAVYATPVSRVNAPPTPPPRAV